MTYHSKYLLTCFIRDFANLVGDYADELSSVYDKLARGSYTRSSCRIDTELLDECFKKEK